MLNLPHVKEYVAGWKKAKSLEDDKVYYFKLCDGFNEEKTGARIKLEYRQALHRRINQRGGEEWRNHPVKGETDMYRDQYNLHNWLQKRIICRRLNTPKLQRRFAHLLWKED